MWGGYYEQFGAGQFILPPWFMVLMTISIGCMLVLLITDLSYNYHFTKWFLKNMKHMSASEKHYWWGSKE